MGLERRIALIKQLQDLRGSRVICYLTSVRQNVPALIAEDAVRVTFDHLLLMSERPVEKLDIFLCSNGGSGTVPWRLVSLFREFSRHFSVIVPYRAYSAATMIALGADEIVMHPFGELGPIDPTVSNEFNPTDPQSHQRLGISVEDVKAYVNFIKSTVGITHEDELVRAIEILAQKVHPLALGNVERFISQSRMIARKILKTHLAPPDDHQIDEIVENLASKLFFHGHPINRDEAKKDLKLKVNADLPAALETLIWELYLQYEAEFENGDPFMPNCLLAAKRIAGQPATEQCRLLHAVVESERLASRFESTHHYQEIVIGPPGQIGIRDDVIQQGWSHSPVPIPTPGPGPIPTQSAGAPTGEAQSQVP